MKAVAPSVPVCACGEPKIRHLPALWEDQHEYIRNMSLWKRSFFSYAYHFHLHWRWLARADSARSAALGCTWFPFRFYCRHTRSSVSWATPFVARARSRSLRHRVFRLGMTRGDVARDNRKVFDVWRLIISISESRVAFSSSFLLTLLWPRHERTSRMMLVFKVGDITPHFGTP